MIIPRQNQADNAVFIAAKVVGVNNPPSHDRDADFVSRRQV